MAITTRSGVTTTDPQPMFVEASVEKEKDKENEKEDVYIPPPAYKPPLPFPQSRARARVDKQFGKFIDLMSKLHINIPFIDAIVGMPAYGKFLKETLSNNRKLEDLEKSR